MPFLRFTRDRRGYENTYLVHTFRREGKSRSQVLYWFRTPPNVKVGRPALDEEAIRLIEERNPDITFDWPRILRAKVPGRAEAGRPEAGRRRRAPERERDRAAPRAPARETGTEEGARAPVEATQPEPDGADLEADLEQVEPVASQPAGDMPADTGPETTGEPGEPESPPIGEGPETSGLVPEHPVATLLGPEGMARVQARYAELQARISSQDLPPGKLEELRTAAEALNPDTWLTDAEIREGLETFERTYAELRARLGRRRRRPRGVASRDASASGAPESPAAQLAESPARAEDTAPGEGADPPAEASRADDPDPGEGTG